MGVDWLADADEFHLRLAGVLRGARDLRVVEGILVKVWVLFYREVGTGIFRNIAPWKFMGVFRMESEAVTVAVPMLHAEPTKRFRIQRWTLGQLGPDADEEVVD